MNSFIANLVVTRTKRLAGVWIHQSRTSPIAWRKLRKMKKASNEANSYCDGAMAETVQLPMNTPIDNLVVTRKKRYDRSLCLTLVFFHVDLKYLCRSFDELCLRQTLWTSAAD